MILLDCSSCGQPLTKTDFNRTHFVYICLNWQCRLHRQPQGYEAKTLAEQLRWGQKEVISEIKPNLDHRKWKPSDDVNADRKRTNYRKLRDLGVASKEAARNTSDRRIQEIMEARRKIKSTRQK